MRIRQLLPLVLTCFTVACYTSNNPSDDSENAQMDSNTAEVADSNTGDTNPTSASDPETDTPTQPDSASTVEPDSNTGDTDSAGDTTDETDSKSVDATDSDGDTVEKPETDSPGETDSPTIEETDIPLNTDSVEVPNSDPVEGSDSAEDTESESVTDTQDTDLPPDTGSDTTSDSDSASDTTDTEEMSPRTGLPKALVIVIDNSTSLEGGSLDQLYQQFPNEIGGIFADLYNQPLSEIQSRTMTQIAEDFGEPWLIADVEAKAEGHYDAYTSLTDAEATLENFLSAIQTYSDDGHVVDLLFDLHGTTAGNILFYDDSYPVSYVAEQIQSKGLNVSTLYQSVCYASDMIADWEAIGIHAVNGAVGENMYVNFAPGAFVETWISGETFEDAVQQAREADMAEMKTRLQDAAAGNMFLSMVVNGFDFESQSPQVVGGLDPKIHW